MADFPFGDLRFDPANARAIADALMTVIVQTRSFGTPPSTDLAALAIVAARIIQHSRTGKTPQDLLRYLEAYALNVLADLEKPSQPPR